MCWGRINPLLMSWMMGGKVKRAIIVVVVVVGRLWVSYEQHPPPTFPWPCLSRLRFAFAPGVTAAESINFFLISLHTRKSQLLANPRRKTKGKKKGKHE